MSKRFFSFLILSGLFLFLSVPAHALWMWNPKTKEFYNPKYRTQKPPVQQFNDAMKLYDEKKYDLAVIEFKKLAVSYPETKEAAESQYYMGRCWEELGEYYSAFESYQVVMDKYPFSDRSAEIIERQYNLGAKYIEYLKASNVVVAAVQGSTDKATNIYQTVIKNAPYGDYAAPAQYKIAEYLWSRGWYDEARDAYETTIDNYPDSVWAKQARYQLALTDKKRSTEYSYDFKTGQDAIEQFEQVSEMYPERAEEAQQNIVELKSNEAKHYFDSAIFYQKQKNYKAAKMYYQKIVSEYPETSWSQEAQKKIEALPKI